tara:strand:- start:173 stop:325 length:153 start_codon:yes stop_codon:yes gene_type:complete
LQADNAIVLATAPQNGLSFRYPSGTLKANRNVVLKTIKQDLLALRFAAEK